MENVTLATTAGTTELPSLFQGIFGQILEGDRPVLSQHLTATNISSRARNEDLEPNRTLGPTTTLDWRELFVNYKVTEITTQETTTATTTTVTTTATSASSYSTPSTTSTTSSTSTTSTLSTVISTLSTSSLPLSQAATTPPVNSTKTNLDENQIALVALFISITALVIMVLIIMLVIICKHWKRSFHDDPNIFCGCCYKPAKVKAGGCCGPPQSPLSEGGEGMYSNEVKLTSALL